MSSANGPFTSASVFVYSITAGSLSSASFSQVGVSISPLACSPFCSWYARNALAKFSPRRPSITPGEKRPRSSSTCARMFTASEFFPPLNSTELMSSGATLRTGAATAGARLSAMAAKAASSVGRMSILLVPTQRLAPIRVPARRCTRLVFGPHQTKAPMPRSEEQNLMRASCRAFVDDAVIPFIRQNWQREWDMNPDTRLPAAILQGADKIGIRALGVPEEFGGIELEPGSEVQTFALISEEIARGDSGLADKLVQNWKVSVLLRNLAPRHLQEKWFKRLVGDPQFLLAHCLTEPRGASDRWLPYNVPEAAMHTRAVKEDGGHWVINGRKQFISNGYDAGLYVVYANTNPKAGMLQGTSSFLVPRDTKGLTVARCNETMGCRFMNNGELVFEDMRVPADHLLVENDALGQAGIYFRPGKIIQAAKNLGVGVRAFEVTSDYVQNYVQGGRILIKHQGVALRLADMATRIEAVRALLQRAGGAVDGEAPDADTVGKRARVSAAEEIMKGARHAVELQGGNGMMLDFGVEKLLRAAAIFRHRDATVDIPKMKIVKSRFPATAGKY